MTSFPLCIYGISIANLITLERVGGDDTCNPVRTFYTVRHARLGGMFVPEMFLGLVGSCSRKEDWDQQAISNPRRPKLGHTEACHL
jgi:hypothetical protein